jgi:hypothetical protein
MKKVILLTACTLMMFCWNGCSKKEYDTYATLHGAVLDSDTSDPIAGASVVLSPGGKTKTTGSDGHYEFTDLDPAQYTITVQKTGYQTNRKTITAVAGEAAEGNVPLTKNP